MLLGWTYHWQFAGYGCLVGVGHIPYGVGVLAQVVGEEALLPPGHGGGRLVLEDGWMSIAWRPERPAVPDWDAMERDSVSVVSWPEL